MFCKLLFLSSTQDFYLDQFSPTIYMKLSQIDIIVKVAMALHAVLKAIECVSGQIV